MGLVLEGRPKLPKEMRSAQSMSAFERRVEVGLPAVVDENAGVLQQNAEIVDRGYERVEEKLRALGVDIVREDD